MMIRPAIHESTATVVDRAETRGSSTSETIAGASAAANDELLQRVRLFLIGSNLPGLRHIAVEADGDTVILRGSVRTFYEKQLAVRLSRRVAGVIQVVDEIEAWGYMPRAEREGTDARQAARNSLDRA
jgi:osmotically-inducible protein OsmY